MSGRPGAGSRGRGGKFKKYTRGGGKNFSKNLRPLDAEGNEISMWDPKASKLDGSDDDDDSSGEESSMEDAGSSKAAPAQVVSRDERRAAKKAKKDAAIAKAKRANVQVGDLPSSDDSDSDDAGPMLANPNHSKAARMQADAPPKQLDDDGGGGGGGGGGVAEAAAGVEKLAIAKDKGGITRKERESAEAAAAKERYMKAHLAGKTDEAKADMARLAKIREDRARQKAVRDAEEEERKEREAEKRKEIEAKEAKKREAALGPSKKGGKKK